MSRGTAHGKVILLGEHFVVHGTPALAWPLTSATVTVSLERRAAAPWQVATHARPHLERMLRRLGEDPASFGLRVEATLPFSVGLGGSAALAVALLRALGEVDPAEVRRRAHDLEKLAHSRPSGIDDAVVAWSCPVWMESGRARRLELSRQIGALPLWVAVAEPAPSTRASVERVGRFAEQHPERFAALIREAAMVARAGKEAALAGDLAALGRAMNANHRLLRALEVSTPGLERLIEAAKAAGALGAKLTGGGLGGSIVALAPQLDLRPALTRAGARFVMRG